MPSGAVIKRAEPAHPAGIADRRGEAGRAGAGHRRHQDRDAQPKAAAKRGRALARAGFGADIRHRKPH